MSLESVAAELCGVEGVVLYVLVAAVLAFVYRRIDPNSNLGLVLRLFRISLAKSTTTGLTHHAPTSTVPPSNPSPPDPSKDPQPTNASVEKSP